MLSAALLGYLFTTFKKIKPTMKHHPFVEVSMDYTNTDK